MWKNVWKWLQEFLTVCASVCKTPAWMRFIMDLKKRGVKLFILEQATSECIINHLYFGITFSYKDDGGHIYRILKKYIWLIILTNAKIKITNFY